MQTGWTSYRINKKRLKVARNGRQKSGGRGRGLVAVNAKTSRFPRLCPLQSADILMRGGGRARGQDPWIFHCSKIVASGFRFGRYASYGP